MKYKYIFGPLLSRRFGFSLGIDLSPKEKSCNFDCLYCELSVAPLRNEIEDPPSIKDIIFEVKDAILKYPDIDVITITANGEPTLYRDLKELIRELNLIKGDKKSLILSNASTISNQQIQNALRELDIVKLSLDCATKECFKKLDRARGDINLDDIIKGIKEFSKQYRGELVIEILVVKGINDNYEEMDRLNSILSEIRLSRVDLGTIDRPPAYSVERVSQDRLIELSKRFNDIPLHLVYKEQVGEVLDYSKEQILHTIRLRPHSFSDVKELFSQNSKERLQELVDEKKIIITDIAGVKFYIDADSKIKRKRDG